MKPTRSMALALASAATLAGCSLFGGSSVDVDAENVESTVHSLVDQHGLTLISSVYFTESQVWVSSADSEGAFVTAHPTPGKATVEQPTRTGELTTAVAADSLDIHALVDTAIDGQSCDGFAATIKPINDGATAITRHCEGASRETVWAGTGKPIVGDLTSKEEFDETLQRLLEASPPTGHVAITTGQNAEITVFGETEAITYRPGDPPTVWPSAGDGNTSNAFPEAGTDWPAVWDCISAASQDGAVPSVRVSVAYSSDSKQAQLKFWRFNELDPQPDGCAAVPNG